MHDDSLTVISQRPAPRRAAPRRPAPGARGSASMSDAGGPSTGRGGSSAVPHVRGYSILRRLELAGESGLWVVRHDESHAYRILARRLSPGQRALASLPSHPHVLRVLQVVRPPGSGDDDAAAVCELAPGGTLEQICARGTLGQGQAVRVLRQLASALEHCHREGLAFGTLRAGQVLLSAEGDVKLWGPSAVTPAEDWTQDSWALAALGWFMLTGVPAPPERARPPLSSLAAVSPRLTRLLESALADAPAARPTMTGWLKALRRVERDAKPEPLDWLPRAALPETTPQLKTEQLPVLGGSQGTSAGRKSSPGRRARRGAR
jgi:serine/threonine protein kinase